MVRFTSLFDVKERAVTFLSGRKYSVEEMRSMGAGDLLNSMFDFTEKLLALNLSEEEMSLFTAVVLVSAGINRFLLCHTIIILHLSIFVPVVLAGRLFIFINLILMVCHDWIWPNVRIRHFNYANNNSKEKRTIMSAHVIEWQWNRKNKQDGSELLFYLSGVFLDCRFMH